MSQPPRKTTAGQKPDEKTGLTGTAFVDLPLRQFIDSHSLAQELRGGEDIAAWVDELRQRYPQNSTAKLLSSY